MAPLLPSICSPTTSECSGASTRALWPPVTISPSGEGLSGDTCTAIAEFDSLLADQIRVLGPDHPYVLATRRQLSRFTKSGGKSGCGFGDSP